MSDNRTVALTQADRADLAAQMKAQGLSAEALAERANRKVSVVKRMLGGDPVVARSIKRVWAAVWRACLGLNPYQYGRLLFLDCQEVPENGGRR